MDTLLTALGLLLIATAPTLLASGPKNWLVAVAQGLGVQAVVGGVASTVQTVWLSDRAPDLSVEDSVLVTAQGIPFNAAGWTGRTIFESTAPASGGPVAHLDDYLPIVAAQMAAVAAVFAWRKMKDEGLTDPVQLLLWGMLVVNTVCNWL